ncbi:MAG TPA: septum formation initiator family protein [Solirubrobacteraceae bacterium]|nr:septum formation initiator family protein [Solirubrobacteraceae bacterium]
MPLAARLRWDRLGRVAMLCVLVALAYLYASGGVQMLSTWRQARHDDASVAALQREHRQLLRQRAQLTAPGTLETEARKLGMMRANEQPYVVGGLPRR